MRNSLIGSGMTRWIMTAILATAAVALIFALKNSPGRVLPYLPVIVGGFVLTTLVRLRPDSVSKRVYTVLGEGSCGGCLYNLASIVPEADMLRCPECGGAWKTSRVGTLHIGSAMKRLDDPKWRTNPPIFDARGRLLRLVSAKRFAQPVSGLNPRQAEGARRILREGRWLAVVILVFLTLVAGSRAVFFAATIMVIATEPAVGMLLRSLLLSLGVGLLPTALMLALGWLGMYPYLRGRRPLKPQKAADKLAAMRICPCCATELSATANSEGATVCRECGGAWNVDPSAVESRAEAAVGQQ
jgi:hypothetical protein